jgi:hypothetical protein
MAYNKLTIAERLSRKAKWEGGCLVWTGDKDSNGYGRLRYAGKKGYPSHRLAYELANGPIPGGLVVRHQCDNRACINLNHLELGTQQQNVQDMFERKRANRATGEHHGRSKLTQQQVDSIRQRYMPRHRVNGAAAMAREVGIGISAMYDILAGRHWSKPCPPV